MNQTASCWTMASIFCMNLECGKAERAWGRGSPPKVTILWKLASNWVWMARQGLQHMVDCTQAFLRLVRTWLWSEMHPSAICNDRLLVRSWLASRERAKISEW